MLSSLKRKTLDSCLYLCDFTINFYLREKSAIGDREGTAHSVPLSLFKKPSSTSPTLWSKFIVQPKDKFYFKKIRQFWHDSNVLGRRTT